MATSVDRLALLNVALDEILCIPAHEQLMQKTWQAHASAQLGSTACLLLSVA